MRMTEWDGQLILVVDDDEAGRYAMGRVLRHAGFEVLEAGTGGEALLRVAQDRPGLVMLDSRLPDMPGVEVCRRIKASPEGASTPVLQMSASAVDDRSRVTALEGGADGYINSPVDPAVLIATVRSLLRIRTAEQAVQEAALDWQATFDAIRDGVALLDEKAVIRRTNIALPALLGVKRQDLPGRALDALFPLAKCDPPLVEALGTLRRTSSECTLGGRTFHITIDPLLDSADKVRGAVAIVTDITERKLLNQQMQHSQKLESIGLLAGGVAHDFNNLLLGIMGNASLAMDSLDDAEATRPLLHDVVRASERAADLTRQLLAYAGKGRFVVEPVDLSRVVEDMVPLIQSSIPRKVELILKLAPTLPAVQADRTQIEQLVMNLLINAGEAIQNEVGSVVVTTELRRFRADEISAFLTEDKKEGNYIVLQVRDTGSGMDDETRKRIFDPFFSTKFLGRGLGLSAALGIVRGHKGAVRVTSAPGRGTTFEVLFPGGPDAVVPVRPPEVTALVQGRGTILVVDDQEIVRNFLDQALRRAGYEVILAENGQEALNVFARKAGGISMVLLDLVMPVMSGEEVLPHLLTMKPGIRVIVSSGQDEGECMRKLREPRVAGFLQKPYAPAALTALLKTVLGAHAVQPGPRP
jgi:PAS domain S-box-containing protein